MAARPEQIGHVLGPRGWLQVTFPGPVGDVVFDAMPVAASGAPRPAPPPEALQDFVCFSLIPPVPLPHYRAMDIGPHSKTLSTSVTSVCLTYHAGAKHARFRFMELKLGERRYLVMLWPDSTATAPIGFLAHRLYILCRQQQCDLSPLFALADPMHFPHAAAVARTYYSLLSQHPRPVDRWMPACSYVDCNQHIFASPDFETALAKSAFDILSNPERLAVLMRLVYSQSRELRLLGFKHGLWTVDPSAELGNLWAQVEDAVKRRDAGHAMDILRHIARGDNTAPHGQFTLAASAALSYVAHMIPFKILLAKNLLRLTA